MRTILFVLLASSYALAQVPGTPTAATKPTMSEKSAKALTGYLKEWENRMAKVNGLETKLTLTEVADGKTTTYIGEASFLKPSSAIFDIRDKEKPMDDKTRQHYVADGKFFYEYDHNKKVVRRRPLPQDGLSNILLLSFLFGMKADDITKRFDLYTDIDSKKHFTGHFLIITIHPKTKADQQEFLKAELALWVSDDEKYKDQRLLPRRLWLQKPDKDTTTTWELKELTTVAPPAAKFVAPLPKFWTLEDGTKP